MTDTLPDDLAQVLDRWTAAELAGDAAALDALLDAQFLFAGPYGFLLDRQQWQERFTSGDLRFTAFSFTVDAPVRRFGDTAVLVGTQAQRATHRGSPVDGDFRGTLLLTSGPAWRVGGIHLSLRRPPAAP